MAAARAGAIAGFTGTSNVDAARRLGITPVGTMAHSYIQAFTDERNAFTAFAEDFPDRTTFLVDTYDTLDGVRTAIDVAETLGLHGRLGIRIDSGDLLELSAEARRILNAAGHQDVTIVASGGLDEHDVVHLLDAGAPIDVFGVGTRVGTSADAPTIDSVYKLVEFDGRPVVKLSPGKETRPGAKQVWRAEIGDGDVLASRDEAIPSGTTPLLAPVMIGGRRTAGDEPLTVIRDRLAGDLAALPANAARLRDPVSPPLRISERLEEITHEVRAAHRPVRH